MRLFNEMFISLYVIAMTLSGEREAVRYAVTTYAVSPPSKREFLLLSPPRYDTMCLRNTKGKEQCLPSR